MSWFEDVTGTSNSERQAWRDNFNGGLAVGAGASFYNAGYSGGGGGSLGGSKTEVGGVVKGAGTPGPAPTTTVKHVEPTGNTGRGGGPTIVKDNGEWSPTRYAPNQAGGPVTTGNPGPGQQAGTGAGTGTMTGTFWPTKHKNDGPTKQKDDDGLTENDNYRYTGIGFGLTWASNRLTAMGQALEDEMGEIGGIPFQITKLTEEIAINGTRLGSHMYGVGWNSGVGPALNQAHDVISNAWNAGWDDNIPGDQPHPNDFTARAGW